MRSLEHDHIRRQRIPPELVSMLRHIGTFQGNEGLYSGQTPQISEPLRKVAIIQSTQSSNCIEGVTVPADRLMDLIANKTKPGDRFWRKRAESHRKFENTGARAGEKPDLSGTSGDR